MSAQELTTLHPSSDFALVVRAGAICIDPAEGDTTDCADSRALLACRFSGTASVRPYCSHPFHFGHDGEGNFTNCRVSEDGALVIVFDDHGLPAGDLWLELAFYIPNTGYPDGTRRTVGRIDAQVRLDRNASIAVGDYAVEVTLPFLFADVYRQAVALGFSGTAAEFYETFRQIPAAVESAGTLGAVLTDIQRGKEAVAEALTLQGAATDGAEALTVMAERVRGLKLAVEGEEGYYPPSHWGSGRVDLANVCHNNRRAGYPGMAAFSFGRPAKLTLTGASAYLTSAGDFITEDGEYIWPEGDDTAYMRHAWLICYYETETYTMPRPGDFGVGTVIEVMAFEGKCQWRCPTQTLSVLSLLCEMFSSTTYANAQNGNYMHTLDAPGLTEWTAGEGIVYNSSFLQTVNLPNLAKATGHSSYGLFYNCSGLRFLTLPALASYTASGATRGLVRECANLAALSLPALTTNSNTYLAYGCSSLKTIEIGGKYSNNHTIAQSCSALEEILLPHATTINAYMANSCTRLKRVIAPEATSWGGYINQGNFINCYALELVDAPRIRTVTHTNQQTALVYYSGNATRGEGVACVINIGDCLSFGESSYRSLLIATSASGLSIGEHVFNIDKLDKSEAATYYFQVSHQSDCNGLTLNLATGVRATTTFGSNMLLSADNLRAYLAALGDNTGFSTLTIKLNSAQLALLSDEDIAVATAKNYTVTA